MTSVATVAYKRRQVVRVVMRGLRILVACAILIGAILPASLAWAEEEIHTVASGESLASIARTYNVGLSDLAQVNGITNMNYVFVGQQLKIPAVASATQVISDQTPLPGNGGYYTIRSGDRLSVIAGRYGLTLENLMRLNGLTNENLIFVGQKIRISARVAALAPNRKEKPIAAQDIYIVQQGDTLQSIADEHSTRVFDLMTINGLPNANFVWPGQRLRIMRPVVSSVANAPADGYRWIEVNLTNQTLTAWQGDTAVLHTNVSTGTYRTPTVTGSYRIGTKLNSQRMMGPGYDLPGVPWVMYFYQGYAIHGTYWHNNFGTPMSHGCVNMRISEAEFIYAWASPGTEVVVHY